MGCLVYGNEKNQKLQKIAGKACLCLIVLFSICTAFMLGRCKEKGTDADTSPDVIVLSGSPDLQYSMDLLEEFSLTSGRGDASEE